MVGEIKLIASADGAEQTIQLKPGAKYPVQPNTNYKVVVDGQAALPPGTKIVRQGNNLVIKFADGEIVELTDWANTLNSNLIELNGAQAYATDTANFVEVTEIESGPGGLAGAQGQGLGSLGEADITSAAATPAGSGAPAAGAAAMSPGAIAGIVLGVAAVGAAGGGGGGGGGGSGPSQPANPAAPTLGLDDNSNTGSKTDSITSVDLPVISGTAPAGATVSVTLPGETLQAVADQSGNWSVTTTRPLPEGDTQISAIASQGGRDSSAAQLTVTVDKTVPAAPTIAPDLTEASDRGISATDNLTSEASPAFSGTGGPAGETVVLIVDENAVGTATINADGTFIVSPDQPLTEGAHEVAFAFRDAAGNQSTAGTQTLVVNLDLTPPTGSPGATPDMATASDSAGSSNTDNITSNRQPVFNGTGTGAPGAALALLANGVQVGGTVVAPNGSYSVTPSAPLADGAYSMTVAFTDDAGNVSTPSAPLSVVIDTVAPIAQAPGLAAASDSGNSGDNRTNDTTPTLQGTGVPGDIVTVDFPVVGGETVKATVNANGIWTATPVAALAQGANTINLSAVDPAGNAGPNSPYNVTIDTVAPNAPAITAVAENAGGGINATEAADGTLVSINLAGTGALAGDRVLVNWRGQEAAYVLTGADITATKAEALVSASVLQLAGNGTFNISALVEDQAGNRSGTSATFANVTVNGVPPPAPNAQLSSSSDSGTVGDNRTNDTTPTITGTAIVGTTIIVTTPKGEVLNSGLVGGGGNWSLTATTPLDEGNNNLQITASDTVGNVSSPTTLALVIDSKAPAAPTVTPNMIDSSDSGALNADNLTSVVRPTFNAPSGSATSGDVVSLIVDGSERATATVLANGGFSLTPTSDLSEGNHTVTYRISDAAGNVSGVSPELQIAVDKTAPAAPVISSVPENDNGGINPTERADGTVVNVGLAGTGVKAGDLLTLSWGAQTVTYTIAADDVSSKSAAVNVLASTINTQGINTNVDVRAKLTDVAGNVGELSAPLQVSVDSTGAGKPTVTVPESSNSTPGINLAEASDGTTVNVGLSGTGAIAGDAVVVNWGSQAVNYTLVQGDINAGTAAITVPSGAITTGNVSVTAVINDQPGNAGTASDALAVTVDLVAPSAPVISNASNITSPTPTVIGIAGTAEPGATVQLFDTDGVTPLGSGSADGAGGWSITSSALSAGDHTIKAKQTDTAGNISPLSVSGILVSVAGAPTATAAESRPLQLHDLLSDDGATNLAAASSLSLPSSHTSLSSLLDEQPIAPSL